MAKRNILYRLYWCISGHPPFEGNPASVIRAILDEDPALPTPGPHLHVDRLPLDLERIILRCLEKDAAARYPTAGRLTAALRAVAAKLPPSRKDSLTRTVAFFQPGRSVVLPVRQDPLDMVSPGDVSRESLLTVAGDWGPGDSEAPTVRLPFRRPSDDDS